MTVGDRVRVSLAVVPTILWCAAIPVAAPYFITCGALAWRLLGGTWSPSFTD